MMAEECCYIDHERTHNSHKELSQINSDNHFKVVRSFTYDLIKKKVISYTIPLDLRVRLYLEKLIRILNPSGP